MAEIIDIDCFKGAHKLSKNCYTESDLQDYIDTQEDYYLCMLLGKDLRDLFVADLVNGVPQTPIYQTIFEKMCVNQSCCTCHEACDCSYYSYGMKYMVTGLVYSQYILLDQYVHTIGGTVSMETSVSKNISFDNLARASDMRWNEAAESWKAIREYIMQNSTDYPDYKGCDLKYSLRDFI